ncbi:MAG: hypothetical protein SAJ12_19460 [Jaaginema sp. PMC 1079.18]|nr:hypothetical protein [Jaaginema sp. PMC 1080.18]MEC4853165.1 hypothetical protein [Jaaginema sp. PMC 1079.18]MEC4868621.1 hypothetical protein [Jaaginema sp. PMC 1078.18]
MMVCLEISRSPTREDRGCTVRYGDSPEGGEWVGCDRLKVATKPQS